MHELRENVVLQKPVSGEYIQHSMCIQSYYKKIFKAATLVDGLHCFACKNIHEAYPGIIMEKRNESWSPPHSISSLLKLHIISKPTATPHQRKGDEWRDKWFKK